MVDGRMVDGGTGGFGRALAQRGWAARLASWAASSAGEARGLVLPRFCLGCGQEGSGLCRACAEADPIAGTTADGLPFVAAVAYGGPVRDAIINHKDHGQRHLVGPLAVLLADAVLAGGFAPDGARGRLVLVPAPSSAVAKRRRAGDDPMLRIATSAARCLARAGHPAVVWRALRVHGRPLDQSGLSAERRRANLEGHIVGSRWPPPSTSVHRGVVLVDDILTTGATIAAARTALLCRGVPVSGAAVIAHPRNGRHRGLPDAGEGRESQVAWR